MQRHLAPLSVLVLIVLFGVLAGPAPAAETPRRGGVLLAAHRRRSRRASTRTRSRRSRRSSRSSPLYSTLLQIEPGSYPNVIGDVATEWKISPDGLTYTFKLRRDVKFHDGRPSPQQNVEASLLYDPSPARRSSGACPEFPAYEA